MKLTIGISPCPNDTFIFEAIYNKSLTLADVEIDFIFADIQTLNEMATRGELDIVKISYAHYFSVMDQYIMLRSGGAMGKGVGPLLISQRILDTNEMSHWKVAIPGIHTTANFLLSFAFPDITNKQSIGFEKIEEMILQNEVDAGVIIHENRFTYDEKGLTKIADLGAIWEEKTGLPILLGGIAVRRNLPYSMQINLNEIIHESIKSATQRKEILTNFIKEHAQEMSEEVMRKHIDLYVNDFSLDIGSSGEKSALYMRDVLKVDSIKKLYI